ncbi:MAG: hypothetical protein M3P96_01815 [Actinomycetota bacterium]|nr:hypothetical protein [Actinomycetota bacterium]
MTRMIQIRNVPDEVHRELKVRAARRGQTLSDYLLQLVSKEISTPSREEVLERVAAREPWNLSRSPADLVREDRNSH